MKQFCTFVLLLITVIDVGYALNITLNKLSTIFLPYQYSPIMYGMQQNAAEQLSYDADRKILYTVGKSWLIYKFTLQENCCIHLNCCSVYGSGGGVGVGGEWGWG